MKVSINGADKGGLPLTLSDLEPGKVKLRFDGGEHYEVLEKEVELEAGKTLELTELELKMTSAEVTFVLKSKGAKVKLVAADGKSRILDLSKGPAKEKLAADKKWQIAATLNGYLPYKKDVAISDKPEFEFEIALEVDRNAKAEESTVAEAKTTTTKPEPKKEAPKAKPASDSGYGTINANSIPPSRVIIAGRPRGTTPVTGVRVKAGRHTVIFIHKKYGRKARSLTVAGGQSKTAVVRFKKPKK